MNKNTRLPIKVVIPHDSDFYAPEPGGGGKTTFGTVDKSLRLDLSNQIQKVEAAFQKTFEARPDLPAVAKVVLKEEAYAKSHRPSMLLQEHTCPIIGVRHFGEVLATATPTGLSNLRARILEDNTKATIANISTIARIEPYNKDDVVEIGLNSLEKLLLSGLHVLKFKLFQHHHSNLDAVLLQAFYEQTRSLDLPDPEEIHYADGLKIFSIRNIKPKALVRLANFVGTQSLSPFPGYQIVRATSSIVREANVEEFPPPKKNVIYPVLGVIDSGTNPNDAILSPWIAARSNFVLDENKDYDHGSFVSGLAVYAHSLNHKDSRFPSMPTKIVDVTALPKDNISVSEPEILQIVEDSLIEHPEVRVWNLSLGTDYPCEDNAFSDFAMSLDEFADKYGVQFVLAAGNYSVPPFRGWPPEKAGIQDRICSPADSVRGITVGSLAHLATANARVQAEHPSPFSRRGPGPMFIPKPEVVHYGGNCTKTGQFAQIGVLSFDGKGNIVESVGTSFASPTVASIVANVHVALPRGTSKNLIKALVIHSALLNSQKLKAQEFSYRGFGVPTDAISVLSCTSNMVTLVFEADLITGLEFEKQSFPIPACMRNISGGVIGEFVITLVYDPPLDAGYGAEYCRSNVEVSLGTYDIGPGGIPVHKKQIPSESGDTKYREKTLVEHGFKWSPVKVYRRRIPKGVTGKEWRLKVNILHRAEYVIPQDHKQNMALTITMIGPKPDSPVYDEVVRLMDRQGWSINDLQVQERYRVAG